NLDSRDDVGFDSADDVSLNPVRFLPHPAVLVVKPAMETASREAGRVHGKFNFDAGKRQTALVNQVEQNGRESVVFEAIENRVVVRNAGDHSPLVGFAEIAHKSAAREAGVDLEGCGEDRIGKWQRWPSTALCWLFLNAGAEIAQQLLKLVLLIRLSGIV